MIDVNDDYREEKICVYKGEEYLVRDNGAVLRHPKTSKKPRPTDNKWTFGKYNDKTGYAEIAGERVHRIVAIAFIGSPPSPQHVVDHIDTNRRNNRPENLRWVTKLENVLLNPITAKKVEYLCGSIENFLKDPSILRDNASDPNFSWMRAVSKEEAAASLERFQNWSKNDKPSIGGSLGEWIYNRNTYRNQTPVFLKNVIESTAVESSEPIKPESQISETNEKVEAISVRDQNLPLEKWPQADELDSDDTGEIYRTNGEIFKLLNDLLEAKKVIKLPDIILPTASKGITIKEAWIDEFQTVSYNCEGRSRIPKSIILSSNDQQIALLVRLNSKRDENEISRLKEKSLNIVELDLSRNKGLNKTQMRHALVTNSSKKQWLHHELILEAKERLKKVCEPIEGVKGGVLHSYLACPITSDTVQDIDCWYCKYNIGSSGSSNGNICFGKSGIQTYRDLLSVVDIKRVGEQITSISYDVDGEIITKTFDAEIKLPGKTIFQLWDEKTCDNLVAHNIYSEWYVLIEEDPNVSFEKEGQVYGKLGRAVEMLGQSRVCSVFDPDSPSWESINIESKNVGIK
jgi:hypothetical protein